MTMKKKRQVVNDKGKKKKSVLDFPGGPVVKTLSSQRRGHRRNIWSDPACHRMWP